MRTVKKRESGCARTPLILPGCLTDPLIGRESAEAGVGLAVAVRAEQNALRELSFNARPAARNAVDGDREFLGGGIEMVELERVDRRCEAAAATRAAKCRYALQLHVLARSHNRVAAVRLRADVTSPMTVSAYEEALVGLCSGAFDRSEESPEREGFGGRIAVMKLERRARPRVAAVLATSAPGTNEFHLDPDPPPSAVVDP
ncbi:MAG TPA: hypothetical protein VIM83_03560 [Candidatus Limnocylindria bacterium]